MTTELLGFTIKPVEYYEVSIYGTHATDIKGNIDVAKTWVKRHMAERSLGISYADFEIVMSIATGMFDLYCANIHRDDDYWFGGKSFDLNFCCDEDGNCSVTLYAVRNINAEPVTDGSKFIRLLERKCDAYTERGETITFQSTVQLKGSTYNLTIKED